MRSTLVTKALFLTCVFLAGCGDDLESSQTTGPTSIDVIDLGIEAGMKADAFERDMRSLEGIDIDEYASTSTNTMQQTHRCVPISTN